MTRIVAGELGGRRLATPGGRGTRPTADRVREALFNALDARVELAGARVADLYAGSGAVGLEAASRGASHVLLVESDPGAARVARVNIAALNVTAVVTLTTARVEQVVAAEPAEPFDVIFADPPYPLSDAALTSVLADLSRNGWLAGGATLVIERASRSPEPIWPSGVEPLRGRRYGETTLWYGRAS